jgi:hypothetical protein
MFWEIHAFERGGIDGKIRILHAKKATENGEGPSKNARWPFLK